jgi:CDP-diacylglycerol pyrophosphatase
VVEKLAAMTTPTHKCGWPTCHAKLPAHLWGCRKHWFRLPLAIRNQIYNAYRVGQNVLTASDDYRAADEAAQKWITDEVLE